MFKIYLYSYPFTPNVIEKYIYLMTFKTQLINETVGS